MKYLDFLYFAYFKNRLLNIVISLIVIVLIITSSLYVYTAQTPSIALTINIWILVLLRLCLVQLNIISYGLNFYLFLYAWKLLYFMIVSDNDPLSYEHLLVGTYLGIIAPIIGCLLSNYFMSMNAKKKFIVENGLKIDQKFTYQENEVFIDVTKRKIIFWTNKRFASPIKYRMYDFEDICSFELIEDKFSNFESNATCTTLGILFLGIWGGLIGSVLDDRKEKDICRNLYANICVNDLKKPLISICFIGHDVERCSLEYQDTLREAHKLIALLTFVQKFRKSSYKKEEDKIS